MAKRKENELEVTPEDEALMSACIKETDEEIALARQMSGENNVSGGSKLPMLRLDGKLGSFYVSTDEVDKDGRMVWEAVGMEIKGTIIKIRKKVNTKKGSKPNLYSFEFDTLQDEIELYESEIKSQTPFAVGKYSDLKAKYPDLKMSEVVYLLDDGTVYRLTIKGGSLNGFWNYLKTFGKNDTVLRYTTKFGSSHEVSDDGFEYEAMTFERGDKNDSWASVKDELTKINLELSQRQMKKLELSEGGNVEEGEILVENIPF